MSVLSIIQNRKCSVMTPIEKSLKKMGSSYILSLDIYLQCVLSRAMLNDFSPSKTPPLSFSDVSKQQRSYDGFMIKMTSITPHFMGMSFHYETMDLPGHTVGHCSVSLCSA